MDEFTLDTGMAGSIAFVGATLGPFFSHDPKLDENKLSVSAEAITQLEFPAAAQAWPFVADDVAEEALRLMQQGLAEGLNAPDLFWEYRRLFVGPAHKVAAPWGSVYTDRDQVIFGSSTLELKAWLRVHGIAVARGESDEPEDHIGTMLSLMAWIAENKPDVLEEYLRLHLFTWSSHFLDIVISETRHPFYTGLAKLTKASLEGIQSVLGIEVEYPRYYR